MSYTRWQVQRALCRTIPAGYKGVQLLWLLVLALPVALIWLVSAGGKKSGSLGPFADIVMGAALGVTLVSAAVSPIVFFAHSLHGHHHTLGWTLVAAGVAGALLFARMALADAA